MEKNELKAITTWQVNVCWYGKNRLSPEYSSIEEAIRATASFLEKFTGKYLQVTYVRNTRYITAG